ncbi:MAG TPA: SDR family NAD(P)-dependent oxidoreductase [Ohtaekwangia sp.]|uniref:SDR family NAD(P)-dependent oxidoreductase n=1 Tax=Ohtaekwangia sp. TaxID=2066019 RepID=UPI002F93F0BD
MEKKWLYMGMAGAAWLMAHAIYRQRTAYKFDDKVVLITGGARGLGLVLARKLAAKGAKLVLCSRTESQLQSAETELRQAGADILTVVCDITKPEQVNDMIARIITHYGRLDVLVNNAGIIQVGPAESFTEADYKIAMDTNFWGALYTMLSAIPHFRKQGEGQIVNITSIGGKVAVPHLLPYTASKFALVGLSQGMHASLRKYNIAVTTVVPGLMQTGSPRNIDVKGDYTREYAWFKIAGSLPLVSMRAEKAAEAIIKAISHKQSELVFPLTSKAVTAIQGIAPELLATVMALVDRLLPAAKGMDTHKGYESESLLSVGLGKRSTAAAIRNNEY